MGNNPRDYWVEAIQEENVQFVEKIFAALNKETGCNFTPNYTQSYINTNLAGKNCHMLKVMQAKKGIRISIQVRRTELFDRILKGLAVDGEISYGIDGRYVLFVTNRIPTCQLVTILVQSAIEGGSLQSSNATSEFIDSVTNNISDLIHSSKERVEDFLSTQQQKIQDKAEKIVKQKKYWIFVEMNLERHFHLDVDQALQDYNGYNTIEELLESEGNDPFYMANDYEYYIAELLGVAVVKTKPNKELYEYFDARGEGFDYDYVDGYNWNYERAPWPEDSEGALGIEKNYPAIATYELLTSEEFDPEKLSIDDASKISYEGLDLEPINTQGDPTDFEMYINGEIVQ